MSSRASKKHWDQHRRYHQHRYRHNHQNNQWSQNDQTCESPKSLLGPWRRQQRQRWPRWTQMPCQNQSPPGMIEYWCWIWLLSGKFKVLEWIKKVEVTLNFTSPFLTAVIGAGPSWYFESDSSWWLVVTWKRITLLDKDNTMATTTVKHFSRMRNTLLDKDYGDLRGRVNGLPATITRRKVWSSRKVD